ncbi:MAG: exosortase A [Burkholderiales bacterium]
MKPETNFEPDTRLNQPLGIVASIAPGLVVLGLIAVYWPTAESVEAIWRRSETFAHGYVVIPIVLWLIWRKRDVLSTMSPKPFWPGLVAVAVFGFGWLLGRMAGVIGLEQFALLFMILAAIVTVIGLPIARTIAFPLAYLVFAVPFGEFLVPWLMDHTADFTIAAVRASGVPVFREGNHFSIPTGRWSVVEACSGIRYLLASVTVGTLYAYLSYRTLRKRVLFIAVSIVVPIIANWLRAYMIVMLGHLSGNKIAVGVDHIIYGWIFFGVVITIMFWIGSFWREDEAQTATAGPRPAEYSRSSLRNGPVAFALAAALVLGAIWRPLGTELEQHAQSAAAEIPAVLGAAGWQAADESRPAWVPHYVGSHRSRRQWFMKDGHIVGLYVAMYSQQTQGNELIGSQNQLVTAKDKFWVKTSEGRRPMAWNGATIDVRTTEITGESTRLAVRSWYWVNGQFTSNDTAAKAMLAAAKLFLEPDHSAVIVIYTQKFGPAAQADAVLDAFSREMAPAVMAALRVATGE